MNMKKIGGASALCGVLLLCIFASGCSGDKPATYACKHAGLGEVGLECLPHGMSAELSVYKARRSGNDVVGVVALPPALFLHGSYGQKEADGRLHLFREAGQKFVDVGCYGSSTSTVTVDKTEWKITDCSRGAYVQGNIFGKGEFGIYLRQGADVRKSMERVIGSVRSGGRPFMVM